MAELNKNDKDPSDSLRDDSRVCIVMSISMTVPKYF